MTSLDPLQSVEKIISREIIPKYTLTPCNGIYLFSVDLISEKQEPEIIVDSIDGNDYHLQKGEVIIPSFFLMTKSIVFFYEEQNI